MSLLYPDILGNRYSRTSAVDIEIDNVLSIEGCTAMKIQRKVTRGASYGHRMQKQGRTRGKFEYDASMDTYIADYNSILEYLSTKEPGVGVFDVAFYLSIALFEEGSGTTLWQLIGCTISGETDNEIKDSDWGDDLVKGLTFDVMTILKDGVSAGLENTPFGQIGAA